MSWDEALADKFLAEHPEESARFLERFQTADLADYLGALPAEQAARIFSRFSPGFGIAVFRELPVPLQIAIVEHLPVDVAGSLLRRLPLSERTRLCDGVSKPVAAALRQVLSYPEDSAGGLMNPHYPALVADMTASEAVAALRGSERRNLPEIYVVDRAHKLLGLLASSELLLSDPTTSVSELVEPVATGLSPFIDVRDLLENADLLAHRVLPVVSEDNVYLGALSYDLLAARIGGASPRDGDARRKEAAAALGHLFALGFTALTSLVEEDDPRPPPETHDLRIPRP